MRVGIGQINPFVGDVEGNTRAILARVREAREASCRLVVFPEFALPGPAPQDLLLRPGLVDACRSAVEAIRDASEGIAVVFGSVAESRRGHDVGGCAVVVEDGTLVDTVRDDRAGAAPSGLETVTLGGLRYGITMGEDVDQEAIDVASALGAGWVLHLASSPFRVGIDAERRQAAARAAREAGSGILVANGVGGVDGTVFDGASFAVDAAGRLLLRAARFDEGLFVVDLDAARSVRVPPEDPTSEMRSAIVLGLRDYVRRSGFDRVVIGVSGGIDSALVATLAVEALGADSVIATFIPCEYSSKQSADDARRLAAGLGIELVEMPASRVHDELRKALPFQAAGIVDENLQARARAVLWMALANERRALVLAAGNKTESAVGYATLYGDTTGALAPIGDLYKDDVYRLAESLGARIPRSILTKAPSAELRPGHRDDDDLPPYPILDRLLRALIDENASRGDLIERGFGEDLVDDILRRFYSSEFKRRQMPPAIVVSAAPLSRRRMPLTHGYRG